MIWGEYMLVDCHGNSSRELGEVNSSEKEWLAQSDVKLNCENNDAHWLDSLAIWPPLLEISDTQVKSLISNEKKYQHYLWG